MSIKKIVSSPIWFLIGAILFLVGAIKLFLQNNTTEAIIYFTAALLFFLGYGRQKCFIKGRK